MKTKSVLWPALALLVAAVVGVAVHKVWPLLNPELVHVAALDPACDLRHAPCVSSLPGEARVRFSIEPQGIPQVQPLQLEVRVDGVDAQAVEVDFSGVDMNMGFNRPRLEQVAPGRFQGQGMLPVCVRSRMDWEARVLVKTDDGILAVPHRFETFKQ